MSYYYYYHYHIHSAFVTMQDTLTLEQLGCATNKIGYNSTALILHNSVTNIDYTDNKTNIN